MSQRKTTDAYAAAGVNIDAGNEAVRRMRAHVRSARTPGVVTDIGSFGGLFRLPAGYRQPVLVGSTDGVGTKIMVAAAVDRYETVGQDLVNHCVNDILVQGARPLFFMDYFATGRLDPRMAEQIVKGLAKACRENGCALLGGETAEMPGLYRGRDFDLAGTIVGLVESREVIDGSRIRPGDVILGLPSTGLHTNGYSLARRIFFKTLRMKPATRVPGFTRTVADLLLTVHRSYLPVVSPLLKAVRIKGMAHITGGGLVENIPRVLPDRCQAVIQKAAWSVPPLFAFLQAKGRVSEAVMYRTFNMGIGMVLILSPGDAEKAVRLLRARRERVVTLGMIEKGPKGVTLV